MRLWLYLKQILDAMRGFSLQPVDAVAVQVHGD